MGPLYKATLLIYPRAHRTHWAHRSSKPNLEPLTGPTAGPTLGPHPQEVPRTVIRVSVDYEAPNPRRPRCQHLAGGSSDTLLARARDQDGGSPWPLTPRSA